MQLVWLKPHFHAAWQTIPTFGKPATSCKRGAADMVDGFFALVANTLVSGEDVKLSGFGNFKVRLKASRPGRNPRTGEAVTIPAHRCHTN